MKFERIKVGDILYDVHSERLGNTTIRSVGVWRVKILEVHEDHAIVSWNGNSPQRYSRKQIARLRAKEPTLIKCGFGYRLAKRGEVQP